MRITYIRTGLLALLLLAATAVTFYAQTSETGGASPQAAPSQTAPSQPTPDQQPAAAPSQNASPQSAPEQQPSAAPSPAPQQQPSQAAPQSGQSGSASQNNKADDNPLGLTEEQKTKLRPIIADENQQMEAVRNDSSLSTEQKVAKANQIRENASPKIRAVLTPEQLQKLAELQKARQQEQGGSSQQNGPSNGTQKPQ